MTDAYTHTFCRYKADSHTQSCYASPDKWNDDSKATRDFLASLNQDLVYSLGADPIINDGGGRRFIDAGVSERR